MIFLKKGTRIALISVAVALILAVITVVVIKIIDIGKIESALDKPEKITDIYLINGFSDERIELSDEEYQLVNEKIRDLKFEKEGEMPSLEMCIVVKTSHDKEFVLKYSQTEGLYLSGNGIAGYFDGGEDIEALLIKAEKENSYGGGIIDYAEIANGMKGSSEG